MACSCYSLLFIILALSLSFIRQEMLQQDNYSLEDQTKNVVKKQCDILWRAGLRGILSVEARGHFLPLWINLCQGCDFRAPSKYL